MSEKTWNKLNEINKEEVKQGVKFDGYLLVSSVNQLLNNKDPYLSMVLQDDSGTMDAKLWKAKPEQIAICKAGDVVHFRGDVIVYNNALQMKVYEVAVPTLITNPADFVKQSKVSKEVLEAHLASYINDITNPVLRKIIDKLMKTYGEQFYEHPAAMRVHHNVARGLATHVVEMLQTGKALCTIYPQLDPSLLYAGIIAHDLGKIVELSGAVATEYTVAGNLLGHISIMQSEVDRVARELGEQESEEAILLRHMVLSHHGKLEYSSPVLPMFPEADMLNYIDEISSRLNIMDKIYEEVEPGTFSNPIRWMDGRKLYKRK
ncbi:MAG: 3'-5' exoribonuclease YhaM family protein [Erysipelotrichaceae bacterium]